MKLTEEEFFKKKKLPSITTQAVNFSTSIIKHVVGGLPQISDEEQKNRMSICEQCINFIKNEDNPRCSECGCYLKVKTSWANESCPIGKWGSKDITNGSSGCNCKE